MRVLSKNAFCFTEGLIGICFRILREHVEWIWNCRRRKGPDGASGAVLGDCPTPDIESYSGQLLFLDNYRFRLSFMPR